MGTYSKGIGIAYMLRDGLIVSSTRLFHCNGDNVIWNIYCDFSSVMFDIRADSTFLGVSRIIHISWLVNVNSGNPTIVLVDLPYIL